MRTRSVVAALAAAIVLVPTTGVAQEDEHRLDTMRQVSTHMGEMVAGMEAATDTPGLESIRFEPWQMIDEMFFRDDVVYLMRHGPTDWSKLDIKDVAPTDCDNQRVMSDEGKVAMETLGIVLASNGILPSEIKVSEWCRNQETVEHLQIGFDSVDPEIRGTIPVETVPGINLLLSLQGAPDVTSLEQLVGEWDGSDGRGPRLIISHFTNIEEFTQFNVYEGEILVLDPKRDNRVLGYLRLASAAPDVGHFSVAQ